MAAPSQPLPPVSAEDAMRWYEGKDFSSDWTSWHFPVWLGLLARFRDKPARVLEIGSWEGRSALFFVNYLPQAHVTCVDPWTGNVEHALDAHFAALVPHSERRFIDNLAPFAARIERVKASSKDALPDLAIAGRKFDLVYIDGSHRAADVFADATLAWPLTAPGGVVIFDDYLWDGFPEPANTPKLGIDAFLASVAGQFGTLHHDYQVAIEKRG
jgi:predicted O-methyltransferase YrrM